MKEKTFECLNTDWIRLCLQEIGIMNIKPVRTRGEQSLRFSASDEQMTSAKKIFLQVEAWFVEVTD